ncbi:hypothetical protein AAEX28_13340 [Lentisphaerota bacterium WC36G]|nr:hypothetical protein LJT99_00105 [Lentisphaerae bacterium WC36]
MNEIKINEINQIITDLKKLEANRVIDQLTTNLENFKEEIKNENISDYSYKFRLDCYKIAYEKNYDNLNNATNHNYRGVFDFALQALKTGILINGGASVAIFAFLGQIVKEAPQLVSSISWGLFWFTISVGCIGLACIFSYLCQYHVAYIKEKFFESLFRYIVLILGVSAILLFLVGSCQVFFTLKDFYNPQINNIDNIFMIPFFKF